MSLTFRRALFAFFSFLFLIAGSAIVLYGFGWRINWEDFRLQKTGAVAVQTRPNGVTIKINGRIHPDKSTIIQSNTLIDNLLPKKYEVVIEKDGYQSYKKILSVKPGEVEAINIKLVPKEPEPETLINNLKGNEIYDVSADLKKIITFSSSHKTFYLYDFGNPKTALNINAFLLNLKSAVSSTAAAGTIKKAAFFPFDSNRLIIERGSRLQIIDTNKNTVEDLTEPERHVLAWDVKNSSVYLLSTGALNSRLFVVSSYNLVFKTKTDIGTINASAGIPDISGLKTSDDGNKFAILDNFGNLFISTSADVLEFQKLAGAIKIFDFSPNNKAILFVGENGEVKIKFLEEWNFAFRKKAGDESRLKIQEGAPFKKIRWQKNSLAILAASANTAYVIEIDDRPPLNIYKIIGEISASFYKTSDDVLYFINKNTLQKISLGT